MAFTLMIFRDGASVFSQPGALPETALQELIAAAGGWDMREAPDVITALPHPRGVPTIAMEEYSWLTLTPSR